MSTAQLTAHDAWIDSRRSAVTAPEGFLSLVLTHWSPAGEGPVDDATARAGHPDAAILTRQQRADIDTGALQEGYRIWRQDSPAQQAFEEIETYDHDPAWVFEGRFELVDEERILPFEHVLDAGATRGLPVSGDLVFEYEGEEVRLAAFDAIYGGKPTLHLVFADQTNGVETYGTGRFLFVPRPASDDPLAPGDSIPVTIDFNRAFVPPCGFSSQANCPLPPLQNRLPFAVRAGEKRVRWADGFDLHA